MKGSWEVPEAGLLDTLCTLYFPDVTLPEAEEMANVVFEQNALFETN